MKRDPFLGLLLLVARAHGATSDQIERALAGDSSREAQAELLDRLRPWPVFREPPWKGFPGSA